MSQENVEIAALDATSSSPAAFGVEPVDRGHAAVRKLCPPARWRLCKVL